MRDVPALSGRYRPDVSGYLGYGEVLSEGVEDGTQVMGHPRQPLCLLYNGAPHCDKECMYRQFLAFEQDFRDHPGEYEVTDGDALLRDCQWRDKLTPFRTQRAPGHYQYAPPRKLLLDGDTYCLRDALSEPGYNRSLDGAEETQRVTIFSAMDPATPVGFFTFHRAVARDGDVLKLYLLPNFLYVAPPYRGLGYGRTLTATALEVWESELHYQAGRYRKRVSLDVQIDADTFTHPVARRVLDRLVRNTREALESCQSFWGCPTRRLHVVRGDR